MATPGLDYFLEVTQRAGLPVGTDKAGLKKMNAAAPLSKFAVDPIVRGDNASVLSELSDERAKKVQRLADMDKRLRAVYGKGGKLESNDPFLLEGMLGTATNIEAANVGLTDAATANAEKQIETRVNDVAKFYQDLITSTGRELKLNAGTGAGSGSASDIGAIDWDAELGEAVGIGIDDYSEDEINTILSEYGLE